jgi:hypothetical protein
MSLVIYLSVVPVQKRGCESIGTHPTTECVPTVGHCVEGCLTLLYWATAGVGKYHKGATAQERSGNMELRIPASVASAREILTKSL